MSWVETVKEQLRSASVERSEFEVAVLLGLLAQEGVDDLDHPLPSVSSEELTEAAESALDALSEVEETDQWWVSWDRVSLMSEVCAAAHVLGMSEAVAPAAEIAAGVVRAFPEEWAEHSMAATAMLEKKLDRNSRRFWQAVAAAAKAAEELSILAR